MLVFNRVSSLLFGFLQFAARQIFIICSGVPLPSRSQHLAFFSARNAPHPHPSAFFSATDALSKRKSRYILFHCQTLVPQRFACRCCQPSSFHRMNPTQPLAPVSLDKIGLGAVTSHPGHQTDGNCWRGLYTCNAYTNGEIPNWHQIQTGDRYPVKLFSGC